MARNSLGQDSRFPGCFGPSTSRIQTWAPVGEASQASAPIPDFVKDNKYRNRNIIQNINTKNKNNV
jgi:hypothetical protein